MRFRPINFLLLTCVTLWAAGAAQYVHERVEHAGHDEDRPLVEASDARVHLDPSHPGKHPDRHDHDDCPTCQLLAHMKAERAAPPAAVACAHQPCFVRVTLTEQRPPRAHSRRALPIRGPPSVAGLSA